MLHLRSVVSAAMLALRYDGSNSWVEQHEQHIGKWQHFHVGRRWGCRGGAACGNMKVLGPQ
jgi:hypothetical protein